MKVQGYCSLIASLFQFDICSSTCLNYFECQKGSLKTKQIIQNKCDLHFINLKRVAKRKPKFDVIAIEMEFHLANSQFLMFQVIRVFPQQAGIPLPRRGRDLVVNLIFISYKVRVCAYKRWVSWAKNFAEEKCAWWSKGKWNGDWKWLLQPPRVKFKTSSVLGITSSVLCCKKYRLYNGPTGISQTFRFT